MAYRRGHHSTSDDSLRYRTSTEISTSPDPVFRLRQYLYGDRGGAGDALEKDMRSQARDEAVRALKTAESERKPAVLAGVFDDVYHEIEPHIRAQREALKEHIERNWEKYAMDKYRGEA